MSTTLEQFEDIKKQVDNLGKMVAKLAGAIKGLEQTQQNLSMMLISVVDTVDRKGLITRDEFQNGLDRAQQSIAVSQVNDAVANGDLVEVDAVTEQSVVLVRHEKLHNDGLIEEIMPLACLARPVTYLGKKVGDRAPVEGGENEFFTIKKIYVGVDREISGEQEGNKADVSQ